jgi:hypothetical protein
MLVFCFIKLYLIQVGVITISFGLVPLFKNNHKGYTDLYYHKGQCKLEHVCDQRLHIIKTNQELIGVVNLTIFFDIIYIKVDKNIAVYLLFA